MYKFKSRYEKTWPVKRLIFDSFLIGVAIIYIIIVCVNAEIYPFCPQKVTVHEKVYHPLSTDHGGAIIIAFLWFVLVSREVMNFAVFPKRYFLSAHWIIQGFSLISGIQLKSTVPQPAKVDLNKKSFPKQKTI